MEIQANTKSKYLYHYTTKEKLIEYILPSLNLKLNFLKNTNDPKEKKISTKHAIQNVEFAGQYIELSSKLKELLDTNYKICCFSTDYFKDEESYEGYNLPRMWAAYGDNHRGVCLVIDKQMFIEENNVDNISSFLNLVNYKSDPSNLIQNNNMELTLNNRQAAEELIQLNSDKIFFTKHHDWVTECEIRFVTKSNINYCSISNSLRKIILGIEFNKYYKPSVVELLKKNNKQDDIPIKQLEFNHLSGNLYIK